MCHSVINYDITITSGTNTVYSSTLQGTSVAIPNVAVGDNITLTATTMCGTTITVTTSEWLHANTLISKYIYT